MEYRILKYFLTVAEESNITHAADVLHISQPALSRQLMQLEEELGTQLFIRGQRSITLTEKGMLLKARAEEIIELTEKTQKEFADFNEGDVTGVVSIGAGEISAVSELAKILAGFAKQYTKVTYAIHSCTADVAKEQLEKGLLDFALLIEPVDYAKYSFYRMKTTEYMGAVMRPDHPLAKKEYITPEDLKGEKLILPSRKSVQSQFETWLGYKLSNSACSSCNLTNNAALMVEQRLGIAVGAECVPTMYDKARFCYRRFYPEIVSHSVLVWKKNTLFGSAATEFLHYITMQLGYGMK